MRKLFIVLLMLPICAYSQLSELAQIQKDKHPERYELIKDFAQDKWNDDYTMQVNEINKQTQAMCNMANMFLKSYYIKGDQFDFKIFGNAIIKWAKRKNDQYNMNIFDSFTKVSNLFKNYIDSINKVVPPINIKDQNKFGVYVGALGDCICLFKTDWAMVEYEYNKQLESKNEL